MTVKKYKSTDEDIENFVREFSRPGDSGEQKAALYNAVSELVLDALERAEIEALERAEIEQEGERVWRRGGRDNE